MCGGLCGLRDRHRYLFADRHVPAGNACGIVRGGIGFHYGKTTAEFNCGKKDRFSASGSRYQGPLTTILSISFLYSIRQDADQAVSSIGQNRQSRGNGLRL
jgi:hypothetical protein